MNNPYAFPLHPESYDEECFGMTLRDYFAAKAMQSFLEEVASGSDQHFYKDIAVGSYRVADAMLKAREQ